VKLIVVSPLAVVVEADDVTHLRAEDETGAFGILPGHADFITALAVSVASWRDARGFEHHIAVRGGMLQVRAGDAILIATPEAMQGEDLHRLEVDVLAKFRQQLIEEQAARSNEQRLYLAAIRQIVRYLRGETAPVTQVGPVRRPATDSRHEL
jgi:F-type H+-transporting ATPase subunit epsilon